MKATPWRQGRGKPHTTNAEEFVGWIYNQNTKKGRWGDSGHGEGELGMNYDSRVI